MDKLICFNNNYSTTKLLLRREPEIVNEPGDKVKSMLFLPPHPERKGEGGLRKKGYFKYSYEIENGRWYACDWRGRRLFDVEPPEKFSVDIEEFKTEDGVIKLPLITVITVVLNGKNHLEKTIQSVVNQTYPNVEYIVIDGGSTDGTVDIIQKYENCIDYWISEPDRGIYDAMNKGIKTACGVWLNFMNTGDYFYGCKVLKDIFNNRCLCRKKYGVIYGFTECRMNSEKFVFKIGSEKKVNNTYLYMPNYHQSMIFSIFALKNVGLYDIFYKLAADFDLINKIDLGGFKLLRINKIISSVSLDGVSQKSYLHSLKEYFIIRQKYIRNLFFTCPLYLDELLKFIIKKNFFERTGLLKFFRKKFKKHRFVYK